MDNLVREFRYAARSLRRDKGFTATVVLTLAVCIGANTATFAIVNSVLLRPLPVPQADRIVLMANQYPKAGAAGTDNSAAPDYYDRLRAVTALSDQAMFKEASRTINVNGTAQRVDGMSVTPSFFPLVRVFPARGRAFTPAEAEIGAEHEVILSNALWQQLYGGSPSAIGRELRLDGVPFTVVGIMPAGFDFVRPEARFWVPLAFTAKQKTTYHSNNWYDIGRLKPGATIAQVQAQVNALNAANLDRFPELKQILINAGYHTTVEPLAQMLVGKVEGALYLLWGGALFVLLIGALNLISLTLARLNVRRKEVATRLALGAGRIQIARQAIAENVLLALAGGLGGLALSKGLLGTLALVGLDRFPRASEVRIDVRVVLMAFGLAIAVGVLIGIAPLAGAFKVNLSGMLRDSSRTGTAGARSRRLRQAMVGVEVGFAFVLLAGAGLLLASFRNLMGVNPGFVASGVLTASTSAPATRYRTDADLRALVERSLDAIRRLPGVVSAGVTDSIPLGGDYSDSVILAEGHTMKPGESLISPSQAVVSPGYFRTLKIGLVRGRYFDDRDDATAPAVIIIDQELARHFWPNQDPIGRRMFAPQNANEITQGPNAHTHWIKVVGVVRPVRQRDLAGERSPFGAYYRPYAQSPQRGFTFAVRTRSEPSDETSAIRAALAGIDPELALFDIETMSQRTELSMASRRTSMLLAVAFAALAMFLSGLGIYGVLAYQVTQRRREIGIRMALGSDAAGVVRLVLAEGLLLVAIGLIAGLAGAAALRKAVETQIYGVQPMDPLVIAAAIVLLGAVAVAACVVPAQRAARVDPVTVLSEA
jgi:putative ABC transport system permease protein